MPVLYANNATSTLAASISDTATSMSVASGHGARFPAITGSDYFYLTLADNAGNIEIVLVYARSTDTMTMVRGLDGTTARAWSAGDKVELRIIRALLDQLKVDARAPYLAETSSPWRTAYGGNAGSNSAANYLIAIGYNAGQNVSGARNILIGGSTGNNIGSNTDHILIGDSIATSADSSYWFGPNILVGNQIGQNVSGTAGYSSSIVIGHQSSTNVSHSNSIVLGHGASKRVSVANSVVIGESANGNVNTVSYSSSNNVIIGHLAFYSSRNSNNNVIIGKNAGYNTTTGNQNVYIGSSAATSNGAGVNNIVIGYNASPSGANNSNEITLGNASITGFRIPGLGISWTSSALPVLTNVLAINTISTTVAANDATTAQIGWRTLTSQTLFGQSDGCMYTSTYNTGSMHQIFGDFRTGQTAVRGRDGGTWTSWRTLLDSGNYTTWTSGPTFRAVRGTAQTVTANAWNKVQCNSENWDTDSAYDNATNFRFQPTRAGYYIVTGNAAAAYQTIASIWKNGGEYQTAGWGSGGAFTTVTSLVYLNGSSDYVEFYVWTDGTSFYQDQTAFSAVFVRA